VWEGVGGWGWKRGVSRVEKADSTGAATGTLGMKQVGVGAVQCIFSYVTSVATAPLDLRFLALWLGSV
jgi:hypothetical protein